jgi:hypothetical protein
MAKSKDKNPAGDVSSEVPWSHTGVAAIFVIGIAVGLALPWWAEKISPRMPDLSELQRIYAAPLHPALPPGSSLVTLSIEPPIMLIRGFLSPEELYAMQKLVLGKWSDGAFRDTSKRNENKTNFLWLPKGQDLEHELIKLVDKRFAEFALVPESHIENGYFARTMKPKDGEFVSLHNDNSDSKMVPNDESSKASRFPRFASLVVYLNTVDQNGLTMFPLAKPLTGSDPTTDLNKFMKHTRGPPAGAHATQQPQPYWRFIDTAFDWQQSDRSTPAKEAAFQTVQRGRDLCEKGSFAGGLKVRSKYDSCLPTLTCR